MRNSEGAEIDDGPEARKRLNAQYESGALKTHPDWAAEYAKPWASQHGRRMLPGPGTHRTRRQTLPRLLLRQCPKCGGDLAIEHETVGYGDYSCIQCGSAWDVEKVQRTRTRRLHIILRRPGFTGEGK